MRAASAAPRIFPSFRDTGEPDTGEHEAAEGVASGPAPASPVPRIPDSLPAAAEAGPTSPADDGPPANQIWERDWQPSTGTLAPLIQLARGETRNATTAPTSSGRPNRPNGSSRLTKSAIPAGSSC